GAGASVYHYKSDASILTGNLSVSALEWSARTNATWTFSKKTDAQLFAFYRAPYATEGSTQLASVSMTLAARYKAWGDKRNIALRISDPFKLQKFGYRTSNGTVVDFSQRFFQSRVIYLSISRSFGQADKLQPKQQDPD